MSAAFRAVCLLYLFVASGYGRAQMIDEQKIAALSKLVRQYKGNLWLSYFSTGKGTHAEVNFYGNETLSDKEYASILRAGIPIHAMTLNSGTLGKESATAILLHSDSLETLSLTEVAISDEVAHSLGQLKELRHVTISAKEEVVSPAVLRSLAKGANLKSLGLISCVLDADGLAALKGFTRLESLRLGFSKLPADGTFVRELHSLRTLGLWKCPQAGLLVKECGGLPLLEELDLRETNVTAEQLTALEKTGLRKLSLMGNPISREAAQAVRKLAGLRSLNVGFGLCDPGAFRLLCETADLEELDCMALRTEDEELAAIKKLQRLRVFNGQSLPVTDAFVASLAECTRLEKLDLSRSNANDATIERLKPLVNLADLELNGTDLTERGLKACGAFRRLRSLRAYSDDLTPEAIQRFRKAHPWIEVNPGD